MHRRAHVEKSPRKIKEPIDWRPAVVPGVFDPPTCVRPAVARTSRDPSGIIKTRPRKGHWAGTGLPPSHPRPRSPAPRTSSTAGTRQDSERLPCASPGRGFDPGGPEPRYNASESSLTSPLTLARTRVAERRGFEWGFGRGALRLTRTLK
jgi:hypothetical protein